MQTEVIRFDNTHHLGEPATRPLSVGFNCCFKVEWRFRVAGCI